MIPENPITRKEEYLNAIATGDPSGLPDPITREEVYLDYIAENGGGGGGTDNYNSLSNKPQINGNTLQGNKTAAQLGLIGTSQTAGLLKNDGTVDQTAYAPAADALTLTDAQWTAIQALLA